MRIVTFVPKFHTAASSLLFTSQHSLVLETLVQILSDVPDDFLRLLGVSLWTCPGCADFRCASCAPPDRLLLDHPVPQRVSRSSLLSVASRNVTSITASCGDPHPVSWFEHTTEVSPRRSSALYSCVRVLNRVRVHPVNLLFTTVFH